MWDEVKFIKGDHQNGDAKIDIGNLNGGKPVSAGRELLLFEVTTISPNFRNSLA